MTRQQTADQSDISLQIGEGDGLARPVRIAVRDKGDRHILRIARLQGQGDALVEVDHAQPRFQRHAFDRGDVVPVAQGTGQQFGVGGLGHNAKA